MYVRIFLVEVCIIMVQWNTLKLKTDLVFLKTSYNALLLRQGPIVYLVITDRSFHAFCFNRVLQYMNCRYLCNGILLIQWNLA